GVSGRRCPVSSARSRIGGAVAGVDTREHGPRALLEEVVRRSVMMAVVAVPLLAASWRVSGGRPLGRFAFEIYLAVAGLLVLCEHGLPWERRGGTGRGGSRTAVPFVIGGSVVNRASLVVCGTTGAPGGRAGAGYSEIDVWRGGWSLGFNRKSTRLNSSHLG